MLWGILITWGLGIICQVTGLYQINPELGCYSLLPDFSKGISIPSLAPTFMQLDFKGILSLDFFVIMFAFLFVALFDTLGTFYYHYFCRKCFWCGRGRTDRSDCSSCGYTLWIIPVFVTYFPSNSVFCYSSSSYSSWISYDNFYHKD